MKSLVVAAMAAAVLMTGCARPTEDALWQQVQQTKARGSFDSTLQAAQNLIREFPDGKNASAALFLLGDINQNLKHDYPAAIRYYRAFAEKYPADSSAPIAMFVVGFIYNNNLQKYDSAKAAYESFMAKFPNHPLVASAKFEIDNLGKTPEEIISSKKEVAEQSKKQSRRK